MRKTIINLLVCAIILGGAFVARYLILDRAAVVSLPSDPLFTSISQSLRNGSYLPIEGKDYKLNHVQYFDNNQWAVATIVPIGTASDSATIVLQKQNGSYEVVLGPANSFVGDDLNGLPADVRKSLGQ